MEAGGLARKIWINPPFLWKCLYQVRVITVFPVFRLLIDFVCLLTYEFCLSLWKIARCSVILLLPLFDLIFEVAVPGQESDDLLFSLLTIWSWHCAENVLYFSLGKYIKIEQISNTLTGINTWMEEHSRSKKTPLQYDIIRNQLSRPVVYTEDTAQNMNIDFNSVKWEFLFFNTQTLMLPYSYVFRCFTHTFCHFGTRH